MNSTWPTISNYNKFNDKIVKHCCYFSIIIPLVWCGFDVKTLL